MESGHLNGILHHFSNGVRAEILTFLMMAVKIFLGSRDF